MDGEWGMNHPELGALIAGSLFGTTYYDLVLLHSRSLARELGATPSKLCWADKASILFEPEWFYLLRARASGELAEYRDKTAGQVRIDESDGKWFKWLKRDLAKAALTKTRCSFFDRKEETEIGGI